MRWLFCGWKEGCTGMWWLLKEGCTGMAGKLQEARNAVAGTQSATPSSLAVSCYQRAHHFNRHKAVMFVRVGFVSTIASPPSCVGHRCCMFFVIHWRQSLLGDRQSTGQREDFSRAVEGRTFLDTQRGRGRGKKIHRGRNTWFLVM